MKRLLCILVLCLSFVEMAQSITLPEQKKSTIVPKDKGIFFDREDIPKFRRLFKSEPMFAKFKAELIQLDRAAERKFLQSEVRYNDHLYDIAHVAKTAQKMAFLYLFSGDKDAAQLAIQCVRTLMRFPKWDYFLDGGVTTFGLQRAPGTVIAVSLCVEFLGDLVKEDERNQWLKTMGERGLEASYHGIYGMRYPEKVKGWSIDPGSTYLEHRPDDSGWDLSRWPIILNTINLKAIPASALAIGTLTYQKYLGETLETAKWLEQAVFSLSTFRDIYEQDGSYSEGVSYANYTTLHLVQAAVALERYATFDLMDLLNWRGYVTFLQEMTIPTHDNPAEIVNFSDAGSGASSAVPFWVAGREFDSQAQWFGQTLAKQHDEWSLLWYDESVPADVPQESSGLWKSDLDWIVARGGYEPKDLVVAMRSGLPHNHEHADRNSIIVKCFGEQLVTDPHRPPYTFTDPSWVMRTTAGHSAILVDGQGHHYVDGSEGTNSSKAKAAIVRSGEQDGYFFWTSNATPAYQLVIPDVKSITRTVLAFQDLPAVVLLDKVRKKEEPSEVQARFFGYNNDSKGTVSAEDAGFLITRPAAQLQATCYAAGGISVKADKLPIPEERANMYPFIEVSTSKALSSFLVSVLLPQNGTEEKSSAKIVPQDDGQYTITIRNSKGQVDIQVFDTGEIPEFKVEFKKS